MNGKIFQFTLVFLMSAAQNIHKIVSMIQTEPETSSTYNNSV